MNYFLGIFSVSSRECSSSNLAKNEKVKVDSKKSTFPQIHMKICVEWGIIISVPDTPSGICAGVVHPPR